MKGHTDSPTGLSLSPDGSFIASNSMDNTGKEYSIFFMNILIVQSVLKFILIVRVWDIRPYASNERCINVLQGHSHNFEKVFF